MNSEYYISYFLPLNVARTLKYGYFQTRTSSLLVIGKPWAMLGKDPKLSITILSRRDGNFRIASRRRATRKFLSSSDNIVLEKFRIYFLAWRKVANNQQCVFPVKPRYLSVLIVDLFCWKEIVSALFLKEWTRTEWQYRGFTGKLYFKGSQYCLMFMLSKTKRSLYILIS